MRTFDLTDEDIRVIFLGWLSTPGALIPHAEPFGVISDRGTHYAALYNTNGMLGVYRLNAKGGWRRVAWTDVPMGVLHDLEANAGKAPEEYRVWA
jgi:hypothetical protein